MIVWFFEAPSAITLTGCRNAGLFIRGISSHIETVFQAGIPLMT